MRAELVELWSRRDLLRTLVRRDIKVRYKNSRLGFVWSVAPPLIEVLVITLVLRYATSLAAGFPSYSAFVLVAMIPWTFFQTAILDSSQSILMMYGVVRKVNIPREIIPLSSAISNFIHFLLSWAVFLLYWWGFRGERILPTSILFPYLIAVQFMLVTGLCLLVSILNVFYEDVKYILTILLRLFFFVLPIMYVAEMFQLNGSRGKWWHDGAIALYRANPLTALITGYRKALLEAPSYEAIKANSLPIDYGSLIFTGIFSFFFLVACYAYFNYRKWQIVERP